MKRKFTVMLSWIVEDVRAEIGADEEDSDEAVIEQYEESITDDMENIPGDASFDITCEEVK